MEGWMDGGMDGVARGSLAADSVTKAADMRESQQGTVGFLFFTLAEIRRGFCQVPRLTPLRIKISLCGAATEFIKHQHVLSLPAALYSISSPADARSFSLSLRSRLPPPPPADNQLSSTVVLP